MERTIVLPRVPEEEISASAVAGLLQQEGVIFVYDKDDTLIGSVIQANDDHWCLRTLYTSEDYDELELLILDYTHYVFKFVT